ncbi:hypothetical protein GCM10010387_15830 [Streptomyces inusitatus]|uniref:Uncharacterized protein n=1 Tax=Streptomyces inusitatus TaxID=68221 RepID=A0A918PUL6_9ACTN|nr:hypothetical protein [Streptomyces inusitatus]GGZ23479.1 hypothetical protein GCM10010387_15830 [Streptomyces inusitatus]
MGIIDTRVIDDMFGPLDCQLAPDNRWNGWLSPAFTLDATRQLSAQTLRMADKYGYDSVDTIHVIDGRADSAETVHIIDSGLTYEINDEGDTAPLAVAVRINWRALNRGESGATEITRANARTRKASRKRTPGGRGARRQVVIQICWMYADESDTAANVVPLRDGRYSIGGWERAWHFASWWCVCGSASDWHEPACEDCDRSRDDQPPVSAPMRIAASRVAETLHRLAPEATSVLIETGTGQPYICSVFAGEAEIDTADDTGPLDTETLGAADEILRQAVDTASGPGELTEAGWHRVEDEAFSTVYRIVFPS